MDNNSGILTVIFVLFIGMMAYLVYNGTIGNFFNDKSKMTCKIEDSDYGDGTKYSAEHHYTFHEDETVKTLNSQNILVFSDFDSYHAHKLSVGELGYFLDTEYDFDDSNLTVRFTTTTEYQIFSDYEREQLAYMVFYDLIKESMQEIGYSCR